ncbi:MAG: Asp-tRNA(Asn)/Glu-tRNA(Gln) amidotransferase subunit GatC [Ectothiorhodospiraceae bacterium]|nr:Asp-tRNA(Asn)/Glu-tRNA(Gln) amidotransferase subunit GatC [Ectothiorhodospiraceae bacterium]
MSSEPSSPSLQKDDIEKIAHLARLGIDEADVPAYASDLNNILALVEQMSAVDTTGVSPMAHPMDAQQRLRDDTVTEQNQREQLMANAPQTEANLFLVPQVIE